MSDSTPLFWAKLGNNHWPDCYHPVACHLADVAAVARELVERLPTGTREWLADRLGLPADQLGPWVGFWVGRTTSAR